MAEPAHLKRLGRTLEAIEAVPDPLVRLDALRVARETFERRELEQVVLLRGAGVTWSRIGELYGLTKQGAQQRFRAAVRTTATPDDSPAAV